MRTVGTSLQTSLDSRETTLCWCWRLTRTDNTQLGFTDHDEPLVFDGTTFEASSGFGATEIAESLGLNVDNLEAEGAIQSGQLNETDLVAGLYDGSVVEVWRVDWSSPEDRIWSSWRWQHRPRQIFCTHQKMPC